MTIFGKMVIGVLLLVVAVGVYYGVSSSVKNDVAPQVVTEDVPTSQESVVATTTASTTTQTDSKKIAFTEFLKKGGSYKCTVTQTVANMTSNGTVYIDNANVKGSFSTSIAGQTIDTNMIAKDGFTYTWTSMSKGVGYKAKIVKEGGDADASSSATYTWNGSQIGEYNCEPWTVDKTMFELPTSVTFTVQ
jgi:hypothetical protein